MIYRLIYCWVQERDAAINLVKSVFRLDDVDVELQTKSIIISSQRDFKHNSFDKS